MVKKTVMLVVTGFLWLLTWLVVTIPFLMHYFAPFYFEMTEEGGNYLLVLISYGIIDNRATCPFFVPILHAALWGSRWKLAKMYGWKDLNWDRV